MKKYVVLFLLSAGVLLSLGAEGDWRNWNHTSREYYFLPVSSSALTLLIILAIGATLITYGKMIDKKAR